MSPNAHLMGQFQSQQQSDNGGAIGDPTPDQINKAGFGFGSILQNVAAMAFGQPTPISLPQQQQAALAAQRERRNRNLILGGVGVLVIIVILLIALKK